MTTGQSTAEFPPLLISLCAPLREALLRADYDTDSVMALLGSPALEALSRGEPVPARRATSDGSALATLVRLFLLNDPCPTDAVAAALAPVDLTAAVAAGLLTLDGPSVTAALDLRPVDLGTGTRWILADLDDSLTHRTITADHVLGVGHASQSLLAATPIDRVGSVLDLGTGCGVQAVHACGYADSVTATDVNARALRIAAANASLNEVEIEFVEGSWFEPVAGRFFDRIVANPPFVVGPARVEHTYRDSGLHLDGASALVISQAPVHLAPGGTAAMLASWVHVAGSDWRTRVASWLPDEGIDAWIVQRDVADPALYVGTWLRDAGYDPRDLGAQARAESWLDSLAAADVEGVGFGFVFLRRIEGPTEVLAEDLRHGFDDPLGTEAMRYFERSAWLRDNDVLGARFALDPATALERVFLPGSEGWRDVVTRVHRGDGPRWQHEIDDDGATLLAGMRADGLALDELIDLLAMATSGRSADAGLILGAVELIQALVRHGLVLPA